MNHLAHEGLENRSFFTGDVMYDSVLYYQSMIIESNGKYLVSGLPDQYFLATIHRAENTDHPTILSAILNALGNAPGTVILPIHPRTRKIIGEQMNLPDNIKIIDPVGYLQMLQLTMKAEKVLTDSGGLQKEAYFLGKPCITLRTETEWVETLHDGWNCIAGSDEVRIIDAMNQPSPSASRKTAFGAGNAASLIVEILRSF
jgi:UDP-GlcNAc3NAcA epimerase